MGAFPDAGVAWAYCVKTVKLPVEEVAMKVLTQLFSSDELMD